MADRAFGLEISVVDADADIGAAFYGTCQVVGDGVAVDVADEEDSAEAGVIGGGVGIAGWLSVGFDEIAVVSGSCHAIYAPVAYGGEVDVHGYGRKALVVDAGASR